MRTRSLVVERMYISVGLTLNSEETKAHSCAEQTDNLSFAMLLRIHASELLHASISFLNQQQSKPYCWFWR